jgi:hypothetical protein
MPEMFYLICLYLEIVAHIVQHLEIKRSIPTRLETPKEQGLAIDKKQIKRGKEHAWFDIAVCITIFSKLDFQIDIVRSVSACARSM